MGLLLVPLVMGGEQAARLQGKTSFPMHSPHTSSLKTKTEMQSKALSVPFLVQYQVMSARKVQLAIMRTTAGHLSWE